MPIQIIKNNSMLAQNCITCQEQQRRRHGAYKWTFPSWCCTTSAAFWELGVALYFPSLSFDFCGNYSRPSGSLMVWAPSLDFGIAAFGCAWFLLFLWYSCFWMRMISSLPLVLTRLYMRLHVNKSCDTQKAKRGRLASQRLKNQFNLTPRLH